MEVKLNQTLLSIVTAMKMFYSSYCHLVDIQYVQIKKIERYLTIHEQTMLTCV